MLLAAKPDLLAVQLLADQLEALQQSCDRLGELHFAGSDGHQGDDAEDVLDRLAALGDFVGRLETAELAIVTKLAQARLWAGAVAKSDIRLRTFAGLFHAGTQALADQIDGLAEPSQSLFDGAACPALFLRQRDLLPQSGALADGSQPIAIDGSYRLCGVTEIGDLVDLCQATLNALDAHYGIYELEQPPAISADPAIETAAAASPIVVEVAVPAAEDAASAAATPEIAVASESAEAPVEATATEAPSEALDAVAKATAVVVAATSEPDPIADAQEAIAEALADTPLAAPHAATSNADAPPEWDAFGNVAPSAEPQATDQTGEEDVVALENAIPEPLAAIGSEPPGSEEIVTLPAEQAPDAPECAVATIVPTDAPAPSLEHDASAADQQAIAAARTMPEPAETPQPETTTELAPRTPDVASTASEPETAPDAIPTPVASVEEPVAAATATVLEDVATEPAEPATADATAPLAREHTLAARLSAIKGKRSA